MNKLKKIFILLMTGLFITSCSLEKTDTVQLTWVPAPDVQEQLDIYVEEGKVTEAKLNEDKTAAILKLTEKQRRGWLTWLENDIDEYTKKANENEHMNISVSEDGKDYTVYADRYVNFYTLTEYSTILLYDCEIMQVLKGIEDWSINYKLYDLDSGNLLYSVAAWPDEKIKVNRDIWDTPVEGEITNDLAE